jgi:hypothetical protein
MGLRGYLNIMFHTQTLQYTKFGPTLYTGNHEIYNFGEGLPAHSKYAFTFILVALKIEVS